VRAVAKGVRRTKSKFGSRLEPLSHVALLGWQGRGDLDMINQVEVIDTFRTVREDLDRMSAAMSMLEVVDQIGQERHGNPRLYEMLVGAMAALAERDSPMVAPAFFLKVLALEGSAPVLDVCVSCGQEDSRLLVAFDLTEGGVLCRSCRRGRPLSAGGLSLLRRTLGGGLAGVLAEPPSAAVDEVTSLATEAMEAHLDRRLRSVHSGQVS
jgi:DNA repair protein RecO (recombination protein O)